MKSKRILSLFMTLLLLVAHVPAYTFAASSSTALNWKAVESGTDAHLRKIAYGNGTFVAMGDKFLSPDLITTSIDDGKTWVPAKVLTGYKKLTALKFLAGKFMLVVTSDDNHNAILTSSNGVDWTSAALPAAYDSIVFSDISRNNDGDIVLVGNLNQSNAYVVTSTDNGATWATTLSLAGNRGCVYTVNFLGDRFVMAGQVAMIYVSNLDGTEWNDFSSYFEERSMTYYNGSIYAENTLVIAGNVFNGGGGRIRTSLDKGDTMIQQTVDTAELSSVSYGGGTFVAVGDKGKISASTDKAVTWSTQKVGDADLYAVGFGSKAFVAVGYLGRIMRSDELASTGGTGGTGGNGGNDPATPISLDAAKYMLGVGGTYSTIVRSNKDDGSSIVITAGVTFASSDSKVAAVDSSGVVTGVGKGTATINVTYTSGGTTYTRYATVTVDPKVPSFLTASDPKAGAVYLNLIDSDNKPLQNATVKISSGTQVWPLVKSDSEGSVLAYLPAGPYNVVVYAINGTTTKNFAFKSLKVLAGQRSTPLMQQQLTTGSATLSVDTMSGGDKKITGLTGAGATVVARDGLTKIGTAIADKTGKFSIALKAAFPGKTLAVTTIDADENEKSLHVQVPLVAAVTLTAAALNNDVDHDFVIPFKDTVGLLAGSVTSVTYDGSELTKTSGYTIAAGKLTIKAGAIPTTGSHTIVVKSSFYVDAQVTQTIKAGLADATKSTYALSAALTAGQTSTVTVTVKDKYGNLAVGKQVYADVTVTNSTKKTAERYTIGGVIHIATAKGKTAGAVTGADGETTLAITIPETVDPGDGISIQLRAGATATAALPLGSAITFTK